MDYNAMILYIDVGAGVFMFIFIVLASFIL